MPKRSRKTRKLPETVNSRRVGSVWKADALAALVKAHGLRDAHLAIATEREVETVRRWLTGRTCPDLVRAKKIATLLGVPLDALLVPEESGGSATSSSERGEKHSK